MDIFSSTSKQVQSAVSVPKAEAAVQTRPVETSHQMEKSAKDDALNEQDISQKLTTIVEKLNSNMRALDTNVMFGYNDKIGTMFVSVMERSTGKMIRKIPTEEAMLLSEKMQEIIGTIFDKKG
jgi:flagellar protein FlaG